MEVEESVGPAGSPEEEEAYLLCGVIGKGGNPCRKRKGTCKRHLQPSSYHSVPPQGAPPAQLEGEPEPCLAASQVLKRMWQPAKGDGKPGKWVKHPVDLAAGQALDAREKTAGGYVRLSNGSWSCAHGRQRSRCKEGCSDLPVERGWCPPPGLDPPGRPRAKRNQEEAFGEVLSDHRGEAADEEAQQVGIVEPSTSGRRSPRSPLPTPRSPLPAPRVRCPHFMAEPRLLSPPLREAPPRRAASARLSRPSQLSPISRAFGCTTVDSVPGAAGARSIDGDTQWLQPGAGVTGGKPYATGITGGEERVTLYNLTTERRLGGASAPQRQNLEASPRLPPRPP
jgi:hypothetical protein